MNPVEFEVEKPQKQTELGWSVYRNTFLALSGDQEWSGTYTGTRVIWEGADSFESLLSHNQVVLELNIQGQPRISSAYLSIHYFGYRELLGSFRCRSLKEATRKADALVNDRLDQLIKKAIDQVYKIREGWRCAYRGETPFCSFYYPSYEISNGKGIPEGEYTFIDWDGHGWRTTFKLGGYFGTGFKADPKFPYWIPKAA